MRGPVAVLLAAMVAASTLTVATPAAACACGAVVTSGGSVSVDDEVAVVRQDGGTEEIVMRLRLSGEPADAAWILPVPAEPTFGLAADALFRQLVDLTRPRVEVRRRWWGRSDEDGGSAAAAAPAPSVEVLNSTRVGPYEVTTLASADTGALAGWLSRHGYRLGPDLARGLQPYVAIGWRYVAVKLSAPSGSSHLDRDLPPLRVRFASARLVYPMRLSNVARHSQPVHLFVIADHRTTLLPVSWRLRSGFAGWLDPGGLAGTPLGAQVPRRAFLTRFDGTVVPGDVPDDYVFGPADDDAEFRPVTYRTEYVELAGIPAGPLILLAVLLAAGAVGGRAVRPRRRIARG